jgi:hypothetical protein
MISKRFLAPVLALVALGLPASASVVAYCDIGNCGLNSTAAFNTLVTADMLVYASAMDLTFTPGSLNAGSYDDGMTGVLFAASGAFSVSGATLQETTGNTITITVPAIYSVMRLSISQVSGGSDTTFLDAGENTQVVLTSAPTQVDFVNTAPGSVWTITIIPSFSGEHIAIGSFNPADANATPELGTLLLIGFGLMAMRWMRRVPRRLFQTPLPA